MRVGLFEKKACNTNRQSLVEFLWDFIRFYSIDPK